MTQHDHRRAWTVKWHMTWVFGLGLALALMVALQASWTLKASSASLQRASADRAVPLLQLASLRYLVTRDRMILMDAAVLQQADVAARRVQEFRNNRSLSDQLWKDYRTTISSQEQQVAAARTQAALAQLVDEGLGPTAQALQAQRYDEAGDLLRSKVSPLHPAYADAIEALVQTQLQAAAALQDTSRASMERSSLGILVLDGMGLALVAGVAWLLTRSAVRLLGPEPAAQPAGTP